MMTVKKLKRILKDVEDDRVVCFWINKELKTVRQTQKAERGVFKTRTFEFGD